MSKRILVLDDDDAILEILSFLLTEEGYQVRTINCGDNVFIEVNTFNPDLLLMDVMLAGMDGRSICRKIKENKLTSALPIILISGTNDLAAVIHQPGAPNDIVEKPFDIMSLLRKIDQCLCDSVTINN